MIFNAIFSSCLAPLHQVALERVQFTTGWWLNAQLRQPHAWLKAVPADGGDAAVRGVIYRLRAHTDVAQRADVIIDIKALNRMLGLGRLIWTRIS